MALTGPGGGSNGKSRLIDFQSSPATQSLALLLVRAVLAVDFIQHGAQKLWGEFGIDGTAAYFSRIGLTPSRPLAIASGGAELGGGVLLGLGLLSLVAALAIVVDMAVAVAAATGAGGFFTVDLSGYRGGYELNLALGALAVVIALMGPGSVSLDRLLGLTGRRGGRVRARRGT
jgi:putative oxidoreductase